MASRRSGCRVSTVTTIAPEGATAAKVLPSGLAPPATLVIFGAGGDLTKRLVVPALIHLVQAGKLPDEFAVIGVDHNEQTSEQWRQNLTKITQAFTQAGLDERAWSWLTSRMRYMPGDFTQSETFSRLEKLLAEREEQDNTSNAFVYLAVADPVGPVIEQLGHAGLTRQSDRTWRRVIVEKCFGHNLVSAEALNAQILKVLSEKTRFIESITSWARKRFRIFWCCALPTASSSRSGTAITSTTYRSRLPKPWGSRAAVASTSEPARCQGHGAEPSVPAPGYDRDGATDLVRRRRGARQKDGAIPSHPSRLAGGDAVRGQYGSGVVLGRKVQDYRHEPNISPDSATETYVALKIGIDNWRWARLLLSVHTASIYQRARPRLPCNSGKRPMRFFATPRSSDLLQYPDAPYPAG